MLKATSSWAVRTLVDKNWKGKSAFFSNLPGEKTHTYLMIVGIITVMWGSIELGLGGGRRHTNNSLNNLKKGTHRL